MDLFGPTTYRSIRGNCYCLMVVDNYSRYTWVFFLHDKADTYDVFKKFITRAENEFELKMKKVRSDNGSEFRNTRVEESCVEKGIKHEFSTKYTPEQNGLVERKNRTMIDMARSMLSEYNVSDSFWAKESTRRVMLLIGPTSCLVFACVHDFKPHLENVI